MRSWRMSKMLLHSPRTTFLQFSKIIFYGATKYLLLGRDISQHVLEKRMCAAWAPQKSLGKWPLKVLHEIKVRPPKWVSSKWKMPHSVLRKIGGIGKWQYVYEHDLSQGNQISKQRHFSGEKYLSWCQFKWISRCCHESWPLEAVLTSNLTSPPQKHSWPWITAS